MYALILAVGLALNSAWRVFRLSRCTSCEPRCPNGHQFEIAGNQGVMFASTAIALAIAVGMLVP